MPIPRPGTLAIDDPHAGLITRDESARANRRAVLPRPRARERSRDRAEGVDARTERASLTVVERPWRPSSRLADVERDHIARTLAQVHGNKAVVARLLGVSRRAFYRQLERHGLHRRTPVLAVRRSEFGSSSVLERAS